VLLFCHSVTSPQIYLLETHLVTIPPALEEGAGRCAACRHWKNGCKG
jgi:hypothetical protein